MVWDKEINLQITMQYTYNIHVFMEMQSLHRKQPNSLSYKNKQFMHW